jgi:hypothetical protein
MDLDPTPSRYISPDHDMPTSCKLNSRTRKRFRDNRPDPHTIHGPLSSLSPPPPPKRTFTNSAPQKTR